MSKTEIMEKYWAEFLLWYADYELEDAINHLDKEIKASRLDAEGEE
jgi:hypothetical protein